MNSYYLGSTVRGNNHSYPISILNVVTGTTGGNSTANFATADNGVVFGAEHIHIKESIAHTNKMKESGWINQGEYKESPRQEWIPMMQTFIDSSGMDMVINDLRIALNVNDVEEALEILRTTWPLFTSVPSADITHPDP